MANWRKKKKFKVPSDSTITQGQGMGAGFMAEGVSKSTQKKHQEFMKTSSHKPMMMRKAMIKGEY